jgi:hypothetical protein
VHRYIHVHCPSHSLYRLTCHALSNLIANLYRPRFDILLVVGLVVQFRFHDLLGEGLSLGRIESTEREREREWGIVSNIKEELIDMIVVVPVVAVVLVVVVVVIVLTFHAPQVPCGRWAGTPRSQAG